MGDMPFIDCSTKADVEMDGIIIPKGERVVAMLRSANRDEEVFDDPKVEARRIFNSFGPLWFAAPFALLTLRYARAGLALFGMANVPFIYISVNYWRTIHPPTTVVPVDRG